MCWTPEAARNLQERFNSGHNGATSSRSRCLIHSAETRGNCTEPCRIWLTVNEASRQRKQRRFVRRLRCRLVRSSPACGFIARCGVRHDGQLGSKRSGNVLAAKDRRAIAAWRSFIDYADERQEHRGFAIFVVLRILPALGGAPTNLLEAKFVP